jgi:uncharacterized repeat protein (TIGR01451 family)
MTASIRLEKLAVLRLGSNGLADVGEQITYQFRFVNTSTAGEAFTSLILNDAKLGLTNLLIPLSTPLTATNAATNAVTITLNPITNSPFTYTLTAADLDQGNVVNTANVIGALANGTTAGPFITSRTTSYPINASLVVTKTAGAIEDTSGPGGAPDEISGNAGDVIVYDFQVKNTSPRTARNLVLSDQFQDGALVPVPLSTGLTDADNDGDDDDLAIGGEVTGQLRYTITQADVDRGYLENTAQASGTTFSNPPNNTIRGS